MKTKALKAKRRTWNPFVQRQWILSEGSWSTEEEDLPIDSREMWFQIHRNPFEKLRLTTREWKNVHPISIQFDGFRWREMLEKRHSRRHEYASDHERNLEANTERSKHGRRRSSLCDEWKIRSHLIFLEGDPSLLSFVGLVEIFQGVQWNLFEHLRNVCSSNELTDERLWRISAGRIVITWLIPNEHVTISIEIYQDRWD